MARGRAANVWLTADLAGSERQALLRKEADCYLKGIGAMAKANVPLDAHVTLYAHLMRHAGFETD
jgi:hypothetical protein